MKWPRGRSGFSADAIRVPPPPEDRKPIPPAYATELQTVFNALNDMNQPQVKWDCGTTGIGVMVSDSLMFQRGQPTPSDPYLGQFLWPGHAAAHARFAGDAGAIGKR